MESAYHVARHFSQLDFEKIKLNLWEDNVGATACLEPALEHNINNDKYHS